MDELTHNALRLAHAIRESKRLHEEGQYLLAYASDLCVARAQARLSWDAEWERMRSRYLRVAADHDDLHS